MRQGTELQEFIDCYKSIYRLLQSLENRITRDATALLIGYHRTVVDVEWNAPQVMEQLNNEH